MPKVRVPQKDGEIVFSYQGDPAKTYKVTDHEITVAVDDVARVLDGVPGATPADDKAKDIAKADDPGAPALPAPTK